MQKQSFEVTIPKYFDEMVNGKSKQFYEIHLSVNGNEWDVKKRYSDFADLHKKLKANHGNIPTIPGKTIFAIKKDTEKEKRRAAFESFLQGIIERDDIRSNEDFNEFIEVNSLYCNLF